MAKKHKKQYSKQQQPNELNFLPRTENQQLLQEALFSNDLTVAIGPAGTGKTFTACTIAAQMLNWGMIEKIVLTRANVSTGKSLGAVPGTLDEKLEPWLLPMLDVLKKALGTCQYEYCKKRSQIELVSVETVRGRSFPNAMILVDESQQLDIHTIKAVTTRIGEDSKMCLMGDPAQSDVKNKSGLLQFKDLLWEYEVPNMSTVTFNLEDIVRSTSCAELVKMFYKAGV